MRQDFEWHRTGFTKGRARDWFPPPRERRPRTWLHDLRDMGLGGLFIGLVVSKGIDANDRADLARIVSATEPAGASTIAGTQFGLCHVGGGTNCVVDGDTFWIGGEKIRIADIDTPETHPPRCAEESARGDRATMRLQALLNAGPVTLEPIDRDTDKYDRKLRIVTRGGASLGDMLVAEGLARPWIGHREPWCV